MKNEEVKNNDTKLKSSKTKTNTKTKTSVRNRKTRDMVDTVCNVITTVVLTLGIGFVSWWLWQVLPILVVFD